LSGNEQIELYSNVYYGQYITDTIEKIKPDIILIDFEVLAHEGNRLSDTLRERHPETKIIVLVPVKDIESILDTVVKAGARGILPKSITSSELVESVIEMIDKGAYIHPTLIPQILEKLVTISKQKSIVKYLLSAREKDILKLVAKGESNQEIADALSISVNTVKSHIGRINEKLNIENRVEMTRYVLLNNLIEDREASYSKIP